MNDNGANAEELRSQLNEIETQLKSEGFASMGEAVSTIQQLRADLKTAEEARD